MVTSVQPNISPTSRYTISETCKLLGIHRNTLRSYVNAGYIKSMQKVHGQRFKGSEILRFWNMFV
ncbi:helix-turn-helix domain-containing protein [Segatella copri]|jgi:predicted site-specific integrase-resolvase|uniref:helix-turn-helix domain-containing protein n=1 Tax=Segatella copri TaxID=165179 RepID=UPI000EF0C0C6|nr:DNA-binding protein [Prevotella sp.]